MNEYFYETMITMWKMRKTTS